MKIRSGDKVIVIAGKDRGKTGKVLRALPKQDRVIVEGVNVLKKHQRAKKKNEKGQILDKTEPIHVSNVELLDPKDGSPTRVGYETVEGRKSRVTKKSGTKIK